MLFSRKCYNKKTPTPAFNTCEFCRFFTFFKNISGQMLLEKHCISPKAVPIAFPVNISNTGQQKWFQHFLFFCGLFTAISWIFLCNLLSKFFLYFSFFCFIMGNYISMASWTSTNIKSIMETKLQVNESNYFSCISPVNQQFHEPTLHLPR